MGYLFIGVFVLLVGICRYVLRVCLYVSTYVRGCRWLRKGVYASSLFSESVFSLTGGGAVSGVTAWMVCIPRGSCSDREAAEPPEWVRGRRPRPARTF